MLRTVPSKARRALAAAAVLLLWAAPVAAQDKPPETPRRQGGVVATEEVEVLTLDVLALDKKDRPVFGLVAADFEVKVAGKVQALDFFEPPSAGPRPKGRGRSDSEERLAGTTTPFSPGGVTARHVLFYVDLEQLPRKTIADAAEALRTSLEHPAVGRYGLLSYFGGTAGGLWDTDASEALLAETDAMASRATGEDSASAQVARRGRGEASPTLSGESPPSYEQRRLLENQLIDDVLFAEQAGGTTRSADEAVGRYLRAERLRVRAAVEELRNTAARLSALEGPRHLVLVSSGTERAPGFNFLTRLQAQRTSGATGGLSASSRSLALPPGVPGANAGLRSGRFGFDSTPLWEIDDLARWLAASGITVHYLDPTSPMNDLPTAEDRGAWQSSQRGTERKNLEESPLRFVETTGGLSRLAADLPAALDTMLSAAAATYRLGVRLAGVDTKKTYSVKVSVKRGGVTALARSAFQPGAKKGLAAANLAAEARRSTVAATVDERRPGAARLAKKPLPVVLEWKGLSTLPSNDPAKPFWKLDVRIPHEALTFRPEEDAMLASVQIAVEAVALDGPLRDSFTDDWLLSYSGPEYKEARDREAVRTVTLQLPPGRWELKVSVHDALGEAFGAATIRVGASR